MIKDLIKFSKKNSILLFLFQLLLIVFNVILGFMFYGIVVVYSQYSLLHWIFTNKELKSKLMQSGYESLDSQEKKIFLGSIMNSFMNIGVTTTALFIGLCLLYFIQHLK